GVGGRHGGGERRSVEGIAHDRDRSRGKLLLRARARERLHLMAALEEPGDQLPPEVPRATGYENDRQCHALPLEWPMAVPRTILHVDMDAFYAAVEQRDRPELKGKPVIVGADPKGGRGRGVVATASYEARAFGVSSAMPISQAYKLCPRGLYVPVDMPKYVAVSRQVMGI